MIGTVTIKVNAAHPQMPLCPFYAHQDSPSQVRIIDVPKAIGKWKITSVQVSANYPDNTSRSAVCSLDGGCWHATLPGSAATGQGLNGFKVTASGVAEDGETAVVGYVLGKGDIFILDDDSTITIGETTIYVHIVDEKGEHPHRGDLFNNNGRWEIFDGTEWISLSGTGDVKHSDFEDIPYDLDPEESTLADTMTKLNLVIKRLREGIVPALALLFSLSVFADYPGAVDVQKAKLANLPGKAMVVTNVVNALPFPNDTVAPGLILSKSTNGVEWIVNPGGGGSLGPIAYITGKTGDISNKNFRVIAEKNPAGQIVASIEQVQFDPEMKTVEEEEARAFQKEMTLNYMITNEVARATGVELDLDEKIRSLSSLGRFISTWNTATGRPGTEPKTTYLEYKGGDYYLVTAVSTNGAPNYIPSGTVYTNGTASAAVAPDTVNFNDIYRHADDGTWIHVPMAGVQTTFEQIAGEPTNNVKLAAALADGRMTGERATNIAQSVVHQFVDDDYLATPSVTNGLRHVLNMDAYNFTPGEWTKTNTDATVTVAGAEVPAYTSLAWNGSKWTCYDSAAAATVDMLGAFEDPNAYTLGFPNSEITERPPVLTVYSRLATTNDLFALESDIIALLAAETNRAYTAETNLAAQIVAEHDRAYTAETNLVAEIVAETNRAQTVEADLDTRIVSETNRAQTAEADINTRLVAETNRAQTAESDLDARLVAETNRAHVAEAALDTRLTAETNRAQVAEAYIDARLVAETNRAQLVEANIDARLVAETNRAQVAEADIRGESAALDARLVAETNRAQLAEADLWTRIDDEDARAQTAEQALDAKIIAETNRAQIAEAAIAADLAAEVTRATGIEGGLRTDLTSETNRAQVAEADIASDIAAEVTRATGVESALNTRLVAETNRAQVAEAAIAAGLAAEVTRATGIEGGLRTDLTAEIQRAITNEATKIPLSQKGAVGGVATLDVNKSVPMTELPSDVKNYAVYANTTSLPRPGSANTIYLTTDDNSLYRYDYTGYIKIGGSGALTNVTWGTITGTLANQTDLNTVLTNHDQRITAEYNRAYTVETNLAANVAKKQDLLPPAIKDYYLHANYSTGTLEWKGVTSGGSAEWGKIGGDLTNQLDLVEVVTNLAISATNYTDRATNEVVNLMTNKQDKLPVVVNDKFLHANKTTGALEWTTALPTSSASDNGKFLAANNGSSKWSYVGAITNGTSGTYNGSFIDANRNARQFLPFYTDWSPDHDIEFVIGRDLSRYDTIRYTNDTWICNKYTGDGSTWTLVGTVDMLGGENGNPDATSLQFPSTSGLTTMRTMSSQMKNTKVLVTEDLATKQDRLPSRIKDGFLHANANDRSYEWVTISKPSFITNETDRSWIDSHAEAGFPTGAIGWVPNEVLIDSLTKYVVEETFNESFGSWYCRMFNKNPVTGNWEYSMSFPMEGDNTNPNATTLNFPGGETTRKLRAIVKTKLVTTNEITKVTLNGTDKCGNTASFYAPETAGTSGQILVSGGSGTPTWMTINFSDYLLRAGGTMTGTLNMNGNASISADGDVTAKSGTFNNSLSSGGSAIVANYVQGYGFKNSNTYLCRTVDNSYLSLRGGTDDQGCKIDLMGDESTEAGVVKIDAKINGSGKRMTLKSTGEATWNGTFNPTQGLKLNPTSGGGNGIDCANNDGLLNISAGTDSPKIYMRGGAKSGSPGVIDIISQNTSASKTLTLNPNGTFTWGGKNVAVAESDTAASWTTDGVMKYRKYNGVVYFNLFGYAVVTPGTNVTIGNLPAAYRPAVQLDFVARTTSSGATILVIIGVNGDVTVYNGGSTASVKYYGYISYPSASN